MMRRFRLWVAQPIHPASLAAFRFGYGIVIAWMMFDHLRPKPIGPTWMRQLFDAAPTPFYFSYPGLAWCQPLSVGMMEAIAWISVVSSLLLAVGFLTRINAWISFLTMAYVMTSDAHLYGNHIALALVYSFLLVWMPSGQTLSVDAWWRGSFRNEGPIPFLSILMLRAQTFLIYFFGGVAKLHPDWLAGEPMQSWFRGGTTAQMIRDTLGPGIADSLVIPLMVQHETALFFSYGGLVFDLTVGLLLLIRRTRLFGLALGTFFHAFNFFFVHNVGLVAVMAFWATLVFCEPDWPCRLMKWLRQPTIPTPDLGWFGIGMILFPIVGALLGWKSTPSGWKEGSLSLRPLAMPAGLVWIVLSTLLPLRHFIIQGDVLFTAEGTAFSWFLMTCNKEGEFLRFEVVDQEPVTLDDSTWRLVDIAHRLDPTQAPPHVVLTFEPPLGYRAFIPPCSAAERSQLRQEWQRTHGRAPTLEATIPAAKFFQRIIQSTEKTSLAHEDRRPTHERAIHVDQLFREMKDPATDSARRRSLYHIFLYQLRLLSNDLATMPEAQRLLMLVRPFDLEPDSPWNVGDEWMLVVDPTLFTPSDGKIFSVLDSKSWKGDRRCYCHLDYLPHPYLRYWSTITPIERAGQISTYLWNDSNELNDHQVQALGYFPYLLRQYSRHVADRWQARFGRRPEVYVTSYLWMNQHDFQPLVDPKRNLDQTTYRYLEHNDWILDYRRKPVPR
ncbi:HTTM domain-containing protein [bacterium]|nr:HTTM domain-containing protein [bacterium]